MGKRTKAAVKAAGKKARITGKQRAARKVNIEVARRAKKSGQKGSSKGAGGKGESKWGGHSRREVMLMTGGSRAKGRVKRAISDLDSLVKAQKNKVRRRRRQEKVELASTKKRQAAGVKSGKAHIKKYKGDKWGGYGRKTIMLQTKGSRSKSAIAEAINRLNTVITMPDGY